jgi:ABC-type lipoprotein export system ATPase subunit
LNTKAIATYPKPPPIERSFNRMCLLLWRAILHDEPTGNLDSQNSEAVMELLRELHRGGATICMVTHDSRYALHADRVIQLFDGRVVDERLAVAHA